MQRYVPLIVINLILIAIIPFVMVSKARLTKDGTPPLHVNLDMDDQPKKKAQASNRLFADNRAMRPQVPGTVSREQNIENEQLVLGRNGDQWVTGFPVEITDEVMQRGKERFEIFCATCHGVDGYGNGMINQRAELLEEGTWVAPTSYHTEQVRERPNGHIYNTIKNGIRNMSGYASQISVEDRWAIVAYVRALQRSQNASVEDVPEAYRDALR